MSKYYLLWRNSFWFKAFDFKGKTNRRDFWQIYLINLIVNILLTIIFGGVLSKIPEVGTLFIGLLYLYLLGAIIPNLAISIRRIQDIGKVPEWILIGLIPVVGPLLLIFWFSRPSANS